MPSVYPGPEIGLGTGASGNALNPLDPKKEKGLEVNAIYDDKDREYLGYLQNRLMKAKRQKDQPQPELNNKTIYQYFEENEKIANTHHLDPKKNDDDVVVSAGTIETKLDSLLANINNLNLKFEVQAFDKENNPVQDLAQSLEDIIYDSEILDRADGAGDDEKKMARQRELLKQGTVFVQEEWLRLFEMKKNLSTKYNGEFKNFTIPEGTLEKVFEGPSRTLLYGPNVFLGDITEFYQENQPYIFVLIHQDYKVAETKYGKFENWKYVQPGRIPSDIADNARTIFDNKWRLTELRAGQVEIVLYQDQPRDEFQIIINGVCMMPIGFPLSAVTPDGKYNIAKQIFRVINSKFAYGGSFVSSGSVKEISMLIDEMLKLFVLKTRKSVTPSYVNTSGRVIDRKVLSPGRISMGFTADQLSPLGKESEGVTQGELGVMNTLTELVNKSTVSDQFTGQQGKSGTTATEVVEMQRQARATLGLTLAACGTLELKLGYLRLWNILANWFEPIGTKLITDLEGARTEVKQYRKTTRQVNIDGEGLGERSVIPMDGTLPTPKVIRLAERQKMKKRGIPIRQVYINPTELKNAEFIFYGQVNQKEKDSSPLLKAMFREEINDIMLLVNLGSAPNTDGLEEELSRVWGKPRSKLFQQKQAQAAPGQVPFGQGPSAAGAAAGFPAPPTNGGAPALKPAMPPTNGGNPALQPGNRAPVAKQIARGVGSRKGMPQLPGVGS
jgi:hypothetical protein